MRDRPAGVSRSRSELPGAPVATRRSTILVSLLLAILGFAAFGNSLGNPLVTDDRIIIEQDERIEHGRIWELLTGEYWAGPRGNLLYRPLVMASFAVNRGISHQPWAFRLPNLLIHIGVAILLFVFARELTGSLLPALVAAILFVIHPVHTEPLNAIVERTDLAVTFFGLASVWLYWRDGNARTAGGWVRPVMAGLAFGIALGCKENGIALVGVVVLLDACRRRSGPFERGNGWRRRRALRCYLPLILIIGAYLTARGMVLGAIVRESSDIAVVDNILAHPEYGLGPGDSLFLARWATPIAVFGKAVLLLLFPDPLSWDYSHATIETVKNVADVRLIVGCAWLALVAVGIVISYRRRRLVLMALGFGLVTYSIVSNTYVIIGALFAERLLYLPSVGYCLFVGLTVEWVLKHVCQQGGRTRPIPAAILMLVLATVGAWYLYLTVNRNRDWRSGPALNAADLQTHPHASRLWWSVAGDTLNAGRFTETIKHAERAIEIYPHSSDAWSLAGLGYWRVGNADRALECLNRSFELGGLGVENAVVAAANVYKTRGGFGKAISLLSEHVAEKPTSATALNNLALYLVIAEPDSLRDPHGALPYIKAAHRMQPDQGDIVDTYLSVLLALDRKEEAIELLRRSLPIISPTDPCHRELASKLDQLSR